jgi:hypothetical protein
MQTDLNTHRFILALFLPTVDPEPRPTVLARMRTAVAVLMIGDLARDGRWPFVLGLLKRPLGE